MTKHTHTEREQQQRQKHLIAIRNAMRLLNTLQRIDMNARIDNEILQPAATHIFNELHVSNAVECNNINHFDFDAWELFAM